MAPRVGGDDNLPIFRPKLGKGRKTAGRARSGSLRDALFGVIRATGGAYRKASGTGTRRRLARIAVRQPSADARRVVLKARFVKMTPRAAKAAALHLRYIERDGVEKDGSKGVLYDADGPARTEAFEEPRKGEKHQFRIILAPEDADELDLTDFVRTYMATVEKDIGRRLEWAAVNHYDTAHPHVHLVVRGVDRRGHEIRFDREYISNGMRWRAQELATWELGPRNELEVQRSRIKEVDQERYTSLDREIERRVQDKVISVRRSDERRLLDGPSDSVLMGRMQFLEDMRLADRLSPTSWALADGWSDRLKEMGMRGDIIKQMHLALRGDPSRYRIVGPDHVIEPTPQEPWSVIHGRVAGKGLSDELGGKYYAVIETASGIGYHVPLDARAAETLRVGDLVAMASRPDRVVPESPGTPPRHRVVLRKEALGLDDQVGHRGPVLLDRLGSRPLAPYGFGSDVRVARQRRTEVLRQLGIDPADPERTAKLRELERRDLGEGLAVRSGQTFLAELPGAFQGRVQLSERAADGTPYAIVTDGVRFVVVQAGADLRSRDGQAVTFDRARGAQWRARAPDIDRGR